MHSTLSFIYTHIHFIWPSITGHFQFQPFCRIFKNIRFFWNFDILKIMLVLIFINAHLIRGTVRKTTKNKRKIIKFRITLYITTLKMIYRFRIQIYEYYTCPQTFVIIDAYSWKYGVFLQSTKIIYNFSLYHAVFSIKFNFSFRKFGKCSRNNIVQW